MSPLGVRDAPIMTTSRPSKWNGYLNPRNSLRANRNPHFSYCSAKPLEHMVAINVDTRSAPDFRIGERLNTGLDEPLEIFVSHIRGTQ